MKITIFNGSIHGPRGNTHAMTECFIEGAQEAGGEVETVFLAKQEIKNCLACMTCWTKTPGVCAVRDDMAALLEKYMASDVVTFATPVYVDNVTGIMKTFIDRLIPLQDPHMEKDENGEAHHVMRYPKYPDVAVISSAGFPEQSHFQVISHYFNRFARNSRTQLVAEIYRGGAILLKMPESSPIAPILAAYRKLLAQAGREVVTQGKLSDETREKLDKPLIPHDLYIMEGNKYWDKKIAKAAKPRDAE